ncbi:peptide ABC transporter substrate-binding protein [Biformimicrobium ophioploci]|uniref:ABC transporter substrate-binding protein n=1 Tax=Biformimicrobium ophioploci TaxID=3036711 RepID=A0ABQ6LZR0_9GAMM|nr:peptide ABC transporter substrate-binding protein [Microbulbifer sp. NKW57]GMG87541.1 ABC transporter substrate-binding protein [Microbulbifer sp. NKW57]
MRGNSTEPNTLDPAAQPGQGVYILWDMYEGLVQSGPDGSVQPAAAERWESEDFEVYTFHLRKNARWSNGDPVTAEDFVYSWRRLASPESPDRQGWFLGSIKVKNARQITEGKLPPEQLGVAALDSHTFQVTLEQPSAIFVDSLTHYALLPVHRATVEGHPDLWTRPRYHVSNGAFRLEEWSVNERVMLVPNEHYWDRENVHLDSVVFLPISSLTAEFNRYRAGDLHITQSIPPAQFDRLRTSVPAEVRAPLVTATFMLDFNGKQPPLDDSNLRKALAYAIDRDTMTSNVLGRGERPAYTLTPATMRAYELPDSHWSQWSQQERERVALRLYREAGYSIAQPLKLEIKYPADEAARAKVGAIAAMWKRVLGIETKLTHLEQNVLDDHLLRSNYQVATWNLFAEFNEPYSALSVMLSESAGPVNGYRDSNYDQLLAQAMQAADTTARNAIYLQAELRFSEDMRATPVYQLTDRKLVKPFVSGYSDHLLGFIYSKDLSIIDH